MKWDQDLLEGKLKEKEIAELGLIALRPYLVSWAQGKDFIEREAEVRKMASNDRANDSWPVHMWRGAFKDPTVAWERGEETLRKHILQTNSSQRKKCFYIYKDLFSDTVSGLEGPGESRKRCWESRWEMMAALTKAVVEQTKGGPGSWGISSTVL